MDLIPLDPHLVKGSHGATPNDKLDWPVFLGDGISADEDATVSYTHMTLPTTPHV